MKVYLSLGSNLGDRQANLEQALCLLGRGGCRVLKRSSVYETAPLYFLKQPAFFNLAAACETALSPAELLALIGRVESSLKRRRLFKNGPRTLDADILFYGQEKISRPGLQVPHPRLAEREFVLAPLAEIAPSLRHPVTGLSAEKMLASLKERGGAEPKNEAQPRGNEAEPPGGARRLPVAYKQAEAWLTALPPPAAAEHYSLVRVKAALAELGGPENKMGLIVHLAGSTGKTSSACMTAAALTANGHKTGLYTSPHLICPRERIKINGRDISEKDFLACFLRVESVAAGELSFFEILTAMAFLYFSLKKTGFAVVEAGLGGRLDATNAADGAVAGITSISMEHVSLLGPRLENIAAHKAGIIKEGAAVLAGLQLPPEALRVVVREAKKAGARVCRPAGLPPSIAALSIPAFQRCNAAFALRAAGLAAGRAGLKFSPARAASALSGSVPRGRFQRLRLEGRRVIVDGAHNMEGIEALVKELSGCRPVCVAAFMGDKDLPRLAGALAAVSSKLILTRSYSYRSADPGAIKRLLSIPARRSVRVVNDPLKALLQAVRLAPVGGTVLVAGSLYLAGDILAGLKGRRALHPGEMLTQNIRPGR